jgi:protoheme IX farnesyltransferase
VIKEYYQLTKPGIIYGNLITAAGGFLLASQGQIQWGLFLAILAGTALVIGSACVFNNYIDRGIDQKMERTKQRAMVKGSISGPAALTYGTILFILGFIVLAWYTNWLTLGIGILAFIIYVAVYGLSKRRSVHGTIVGSFAGAAPVVAGYTTVTDRFDRRRNSRPAT